MPVRGFPDTKARNLFLTGVLQKNPFYGNIIMQHLSIKMKHSVLALVIKES
jgi:hypothetical protein